MDKQPWNSRGSAVTSFPEDLTTILFMPRPFSASFSRAHISIRTLGRDRPYYPNGEIRLCLKLHCVRVFGQQGFPSAISTRNYQLFNMSSRAASSDGVPPIVATVGQDESLESDPNPEYMDETAEFTDDYGPGKLHPIHFGDTLRGSRYKILRKLGAGAFSTVWLVRDRE